MQWMGWSVLIIGLLPSAVRAQDVASSEEVPTVVDTTPGEADASEPAAEMGPPEAGSVSTGYPPPPGDGAHPWAEERNKDKEQFKRPWSSNTKGGRWRSIGIGAAGVTAGFLAHELGHVLMNLAYGNVPTFEGLRYGGFIPFFRISPGVTCNDVGCYHIDTGEPFKGGRSGVYMITSAGFNVQHLISELILSIDPQIRYHRSPFQKGMLFFNLSLSVGYVLSTWFQVKPPIGDIHGMARAAQLNPNWLALLVILPAGLDLFRFFVPNSKWAPWVSRAAKVTFVGVSFVF